MFAHVVSLLAGHVVSLLTGNMEIWKLFSKIINLLFFCVRVGGMCEVHIETLFAAHTTLADVHKDRQAKCKTHQI